jgi:hypothetical protein
MQHESKIKLRFYYISSFSSSLFFFSSMLRHKMNQMQAKKEWLYLTLTQIQITMYALKLIKFTNFMIITFLMRRK